jgi:hypothetical protein
MPFAASDGRILWIGQSIPGLATSTPIVADQYVLVSTPDGRVVAYTSR